MTAEAAAQYNIETTIVPAHYTVPALVDAIVALQRNGAVRKDEPLQLARFIWAAVHGVSMLIIDGQLSHQQTSIDELIEFAVERINTGTVRPAHQNDR